MEEKKRWLGLFSITFYAAVGEGDEAAESTRRKAAHRRKSISEFAGLKSIAEFCSSSAAKLNSFNSVPSHERDGQESGSAARLWCSPPARPLSSGPDDGPRPAKMDDRVRPAPLSLINSARAELSAETFVLRQSPPPCAQRRDSPAALGEPLLPWNVSPRANLFEGTLAIIRISAHAGVKGQKEKKWGGIL
ncbi:hypothetical protein GGTG_06369 [Gaeumannomyces tritici R3-111a-1]|uniref:Uncharacterized protein n=1 Tax=Gaeumannomyces tritici (strain R3-111a-1) TaxID=644352 RepID=J3NYL7_GAET3|nr:hypothetical protein GGTG_06369 [Gaeumannomyces tritici R3-111a-1]EJT76450.1 hypothetical protein GGTG_06369 [Gaeumannomyces tritici R3-111a-1]